MMRSSVEKQNTFKILIAKGADPKVYCSGNLLSFAIEEITSLSLSLNSRWCYEGETSPNEELEKRILDFYHRRGDFTPIEKTELHPADDDLLFERTVTTRTNVPFPKLIK